MGSKKPKGVDPNQISAAIAAARARNAPSAPTRSGGGHSGSVSSVMNEIYGSSNRYSKGPAKKAQAGDLHHDPNEGGIKGLLGKVLGAPGVKTALKTVRMPYSYIASHASDIETAIAHHDALGTLDAMAKAVPGVAGTVAAAQGHLDLNPYHSKRAKKDFWRQTGAGEYYQRALDNNTWDDSQKWMHNKWFKRGVGLVGDVAIDPISYAVPASHFMSGSAEEVAARMLTDGMEHAGEAAAYKAGSDAVAAGASEAEKTIAEAGARESARKSVRDLAARVSKEGKHVISPEELEAMGGGRGGLGWRMPGTGRIGRTVAKPFGKNVEEKIFTIADKGKTNSITRALGAPKNALRSSALADKFAAKMSGELGTEIRSLTRSGDSALHYQGQGLKRAMQVMRAKAASGIRMDPSAYEHLNVGTGEHVVGPTFSHVWAKEVAPAVRGNEAAAMRAVESGNIEGVRGAAELKKFFDDAHNALTAHGVDLGKESDYVPRMWTDQGKNLFEQMRQEKIVATDPKTPMQHARTFMAGDETLSNAEKRQLLEAFHGDGAMETDLHKIAGRYIRYADQAAGRQSMIQELKKWGLAASQEDVDTLLNNLTNKTGKEIFDKIASGSGQLTERGRRQLLKKLRANFAKGTISHSGPMDLGVGGAEFRDPSVLGDDFWMPKSKNPTISVTGGDFGDYHFPEGSAVVSDPTGETANTLMDNWKSDLPYTHPESQRPFDPAAKINDPYTEASAVQDARIADEHLGRGRTRGFSPDTLALEQAKLARVRGIVGEPPPNTASPEIIQDYADKVADTYHRLYGERLHDYGHSGKYQPHANENYTQEIINIDERGRGIPRYREKQLADWSAASQRLTEAEQRIRTAAAQGQVDAQMYADLRSAQREFERLDRLKNEFNADATGQFANTQRDPRPSKMFLQPGSSGLDAESLASAAQAGRDWENISAAQVHQGLGSDWRVREHEYSFNPDAEPGQAISNDHLYGEPPVHDHAAEADLTMEELAAQQAADPLTKTEPFMSHHTVVPNRDMADQQTIMMSVKEHLIQSGHKPLTREEATHLENALFGDGKARFFRVLKAKAASDSLVAKAQATRLQTAYQEGQRLIDLLSVAGSHTPSEIPQIGGTFSTDAAEHVGMFHPETPKPAVERDPILGPPIPKTDADKFRQPWDLRDPSRGEAPYISTPKGGPSKAKPWTMEWRNLGNHPIDSDIAKTMVARYGGRDTEPMLFEEYKQSLERDLAEQQRRLDSPHEAVRASAKKRLPEVQRRLDNAEQDWATAEYVANKPEVEPHHASTEGKAARADRIDKTIGKQRTAYQNSATLGEPKATFKMEYAYGKDAAPHIVQKNTFDAIQAGERTATTRWSASEIAKADSLNVGDTVQFTKKAKDGVETVDRIVHDVETVKFNPRKEGSPPSFTVTSKATGETQTFTPDEFMKRWSEREGWSEARGKRFFADEIKKGRLESRQVVFGESQGQIMEQTQAYWPGTRTQIYDAINEGKVAGEGWHGTSTAQDAGTANAVAPHGPEWHGTGPAGNVDTGMPASTTAPVVASKGLPPMSMDEFIDLQRRVLGAEKDSATITAEQKALLDKGRWLEFSKSRGYTPEQIADYNEYLKRAVGDETTLLGDAQVPVYPRGVDKAEADAWWAQHGDAEDAHPAYKSKSTGPLGSKAPNGEAAWPTVPDNAPSITGGGNWQYDTTGGQANRHMLRVIDRVLEHGNTQDALPMIDQMIEDTAKILEPQVRASIRQSLDDVRDVLTRQTSVQGDIHRLGRPTIAGAADVQMEAELISIQQQLRNAKFAQDPVRTFQRLSKTSSLRKLSEQFGELSNQRLAWLQQSDNTLTTREIADAVNQVNKVNTPEGMKSFLHYYDKTMTYLKAWQLSTPGFHVRNYMGGVFNNYLAGVEFGAVTRFRRALKAFEAGTLDPQQSEWMKNLLENTSAGQYSHHELGVATGELSSYKPWSPSFKPLRFSASTGNRVELDLRGGLFWDRMLKGRTVQDAIEDVNKYHFDYANLSKFETGTVKRILPFYTWTRYNFPLQMQMFAENPAKYRWYAQFTHAREGTGDPGVPVPDYIQNDMFGIPLPTHIGGGQNFLTPDLPFTRTMADAMPDTSNWNPGKLGTYPTLADNFMSQTAVPIKLPAELALSRQFFKGIPLKDTSRTKGSALTRSGPMKGVSDFVGGQTKTDYILDQLIPSLGQARRLAGDDKHKARQLSNIAAYLGIPVRTNTKQDQQNEMMRRQYLKSTYKK